MRDIRETAAVIALLRRRDRLWHHYAALVESAGSAIDVLQGNFEEPTPELPGQLFDSDQGSQPVEDLEPIVEEIRFWSVEGIQVLTVLDEDYPQNLLTVHNRPPVLFVLGQLEPSDARSVAVVGSRAASAEGLELAASIAGDLADASYTVVSGLAMGIDTAAHSETLRRGGRTIAVIGTGVRRAYPKENAALQARLGAETAVISQFWPDAPPTKTSFPMRNAVMSGLALATVVVEAGRTSGARMQARLALEHGRPVFLPSSLVRQHEWAQDYAERPGTFVISSADEVLATIDRLTVVDRLTV